jgi:hypothetical protein
MKKWMKIIGLLLVLILPVAVQADDYTYIITNGTITITDYTGSGGAVDIPSLISGLPVKKIGNNAFEGCTRVTNVTIPDSVTSIERAAFNSCYSLTNVMIGAGVTNIGDYAFYYCTNMVDAVIPDSVTSIGGYAFEHCSSLTNAVIGSSVTRIGYHMFYACTKLTSVMIGTGVTNIGDYAFYYCTSMVNVAIPDNVTRISTYAFQNCTKLTNIMIGNGVTNIGDYSFQSCTNLANVVIPDSVISIGIYAFASCSSLTNATIGSSVTSIETYAFDACTNLTGITVDEGNSTYSSKDGVLFNKSQNTLMQCPKGKAGSYTVPDSVTSIGGSAFSYCSKLTNVMIPNSVTSIGGFAFASCSSLISVTIGNGVTNIGIYAFSSCVSLTGITVDGGNFTYSSMDGVLFNKSQGTLIQCPRKKAGSYTVPDSVTSIGISAFSSCSKLTDVMIPNSVTSIGSGAFQYCYSLTNAIIGISVTNIGDYAFQNCTNLASVVIPSSVTSLGDYTFQYCYGLTNAIIGSSAASIGDWAFYACTKLTSVVIPNSVTSIGSSAFRSCDSLANVMIGAGVTNIGDYAFQSCDNLADVVIPNSVTKIGDYAFQNCIRLTNITIGNGVTNIGDYAFQNCTNLASVVIPDSVISIGRSAFICCTSLTSVMIGTGVTNIESYAFQSCTSLTGVYFKAKAPGLGSSVFVYATNAIVYRLSGTTGWTNPWGTRPTALWFPVSLLSVNGGTGGGSYVYQQQVSITANEPLVEQLFDRWIGATQYVANITSSLAVVTMPALDIVVTATYKMVSDLWTENVMVAQRPGTKFIDISYGVFSTKTNVVKVSLLVSNGTSVINAPTVSGAVGSGVTTGAVKTIVWNAGSDWNGNVDNLTFRILGQDAQGAGVDTPLGKVRILAGQNSGTDPDSGAYSIIVTNALFMDAGEVTKAQWDTVYNWAVTNGYSFTNAGSATASNHPVQTINWYDAAKWCNARSQKEGWTPCYTVTGSVYKTGQKTNTVCNFTVNGYRLPTSAEWQYAARGGLRSKRFPWGDTITHSNDNYYSSASYSYDVSTTRGFHPVYGAGTAPSGSGTTNGYGLYAMAGNVMEWCQDTSGVSRALSGGSFDQYASEARCTYKSWASPTTADYNIGFRTVQRASSSTSAEAPSAIPVDTRDYQLIVSSERGTPVPNIGTNLYAWRATVTGKVNSAVTSGLTKWTSAGWSGAGSVPVFGASTNTGKITLTGLVSSIVWNWNTNYWLEVIKSGSGSVNPTNGWRPAGTNLSLSVAPSNGWLFMGWSGDASGDYTATNIIVPMVRPVSVTAAFSDDADGDGLLNTNETALGTNPRSKDSDGDGMNDPHELIAGTSPTNSVSVLAVQLSTDVSANQISWYGVNGRYYQLEYTDNLTNGWTPKGSVSSGANAQIMKLDVTTGAGRFYRIRVSSSPSGFN